MKAVGQAERRDRIAPGLRWLALAVLVLAAILVPFVLFGDALTQWAASAIAALRQQPWLGAGLIVALLAGDAVLPVPSSLLSTAAGSLFGWQLGWLVIWSGMTLGCVFGYAVGAGASRGLAGRWFALGELERARRRFTDVGPVALIVTRAIPVLAEAATLFAGGARMPFGVFIVATGVANAGVAAAYAGIGAAAASSGSFLVAFIGLVSVPAIVWTGWRLWTRRRAGEPSP